MNANYFKTIWKSSLMIIMLCFGLTSWGQTEIDTLFSDFFSEQTGNFNNPSGNLDSNINFTTQQNSAGNPPAFNKSAGEVRLYYHSSGNGGSITLFAQNGVIITNVQLTTSTTPTVKYNVDGGSDATASLSGSIYTISDIASSNSLKIRNANTSNTQLRITKIKVTYESATTTYTLTYAAVENGTIDGTSPQTVNEGEDGTAVTAVPNEGYHFVNWSDDVATATRQDTNVTEDISVTANFAINTYTVTYDGNGADGDAPVDVNNPYDHGSTVTVSGHGDLTLTNHSFLSWNTQADGLGTAYHTGSTFNITSDVTLYAQWLDESLDPQTITFGPLSAVTYGDAAFELTATSDSGLTVSYASSNENVATIDGNTVTIVGVGTTDITASQLGNEEYQPATPVVQTLTVNPKNLTIADVIVLDKPYDGTTAAEIDISVAWLVGTVAEDDISFAIETVTGEFASADAGTGIEVTLHYEFVVFGPDAANYTLTQPTLTGNINKADQTVTLSDLNAYLGGEAIDLPTVTDQGFAIEYISGNESVATVDGNTLTIVGLGTTEIFAGNSGSSNYNAFTGGFEITVTEAPEEYAGVGVFEKITSLDDLTDGYYVLVGNGTKAMNTTVQSSKFQATTISVTDNKITNPETSIVWKIETVSGNIKTIFNDDANSYVSGGGSNTSLSLNSTADSNSHRWGASVISNLFRFLNQNQTTRALWYNGSVFGQYSTSNTTGYYDLELYKLVPPSTDPLLTVTEEPITGLDYVAGDGPSASQSFVVSGVNLDGSAIVVTAPANFEVSTDDVAFDSSLNLSSTDGTLAETTVYVRLAAGLTADTYSGDITISGGSATEVTIAVSGEVTPICDEGTLTAGTAEASASEVVSGGSVDLSLTGTSTGAGLSYQWQSSTNGTDWSDIDGATAATYTATNITAATYFRAEVTCGVTTVASNSVHVTLPYCEAGVWDVYERISNFEFGDINNSSTAFYGYEDFTAISTDVQKNIATSFTVAIVDPYPTLQVLIWIDLNHDNDFEDSDELVYESPISANATVSGTITIPNTAINGNTRLRIRIFDTAYDTATPCGYTGYGQVEDYTVNIVAAGPTLIANPASVSGLHAIENGAASTPVSFVLSGENLDGSDVIITADGTIFEISETEEGTYSNEIPLTAYDGTETTIWVRFATNQEEGIKNESILISGGGTEEAIEVTVSGEVLSSNPILNVSEEEITNLGYTFGAATSTPASFTISGLNMDGDGDVMLAFTESTDFEMSLAADGTYTDDLLIEDYDGTETTVYVRLKSGEAIGDAYEDILEIMTDYGVDGSVLVFAEVTAPVITTNPDTTVPAMTANAGGTDTETVTVSGTLTANVTATLTGADADQFSVDPGSVTSAGGDFTVTYQPYAVGEHTATLVLSTNGDVTKELTLNGTATFGVPVATDATAIGSDSFTANWNAVAGAESYEIDVYTMESGGFATDLFISEYVEAAPGNRKAIEIFNGTAETISLANYTLKLAANGGNWSGTPIQLSGSIPSGEVFVIAHGTDGGFPTDQTSTSLNFNGDDTIGLFKNDVLIDIFGVQGEDPGTGWEVNGVPNATVDHIITRNSNVASPNITWTHSEWTVGISYTTSTGDAAAQAALTSHTFDGGLSIVYVLEAENVGNTTSYEVTGLDPATTYYYVVRAVAGAETSANSNEIEVETAPEPQTITWTTGNVWSNGDGPTIIDDAIIEGDLTLTGNLSAKTLTVAAGGKITVPANTSLTVEGKITNNGEFTVESDGILYQNNYTGANEGAITVERNSNPMFRLDYTLWSSPVSGMRLVDFSEVSATTPVHGTGTLWNRVYTLGQLAWEQVWATQPDFDNDPLTFTAAKGYLYRSPNLWVVREGENEADPYEGAFIGVPNNGPQSISILNENNFEAIGNPYPSPINADTFLGENLGTLYFWTNTNPPENNTYDGINNWVYYNVAGKTGVDGELEVVDNMPIQPGQGFVIMTEQPTVVFNNSMRTSNNGDFYKMMSNEKHRFWLNLSNEEVVFNQILVGYIEDATQGIDTGIDAKMFAYEGNALYSTIENSEENYVIQGRALPFEVSDVVALGFRAVNAGSFTISLSNFDGLFAANQNIYLKDNYTQALHNLKDGAYSFVSEEGVFDTRFEVVYQPTMSVENPVANNSNWVVYSQENGFQVQTQGFELQNVQVFDLLGRAIYTAQAQGTAHHIPALGAESVYIVKVTTTENVVLSKKVR